MAPEHGPDREMRQALSSLSPSMSRGLSAHSFTESIVLQKCANRGGQSLRVPRRNKEAGPAVVYHIRDPADTRSNRGPAEALRPKQGKAETLVARGLDIDIELPKERPEFSLMPREPNPVLDTEAAGPALEPCALRAVADDDETKSPDSRGAKQPHGIDEDIDALDRLEPRDGPDDEFLPFRGKGRFLKRLADGDDRPLPRFSDAACQTLSPLALGDRDEAVGDAGRQDFQREEEPGPPRAEIAVE